MQMNPKTVNYGRKPRFRQQTVFAKNLGFGVGFGYRNNTTKFSFRNRVVNEWNRPILDKEIISG